MITIIPAIDLIEGRCVRLSQGDFNRRTAYGGDPLEMAKRFEDAGLKRLHLVDLDGARTGQVVNLGVLERIAAGTGLQIDFSGGIKGVANVKEVLDAGATWVSVGSMAVKNPAVFKACLATFGPGRMILGADVKEEGRVAVNGWLEQTETSVYDVIQQYYDLGLKQVFCTDITRDGMLQGPSVALYRDMVDRYPGLDIIASGGVSSLEDVAALDATGCKGVIIGKAIYEGKIGLDELALYNPQNKEAS